MCSSRKPNTRLVDGMTRILPHHVGAFLGSWSQQKCIWSRCQCKVSSRATTSTQTFPHNICSVQTSGLRSTRGAPLPGANIAPGQWWPINREATERIQKWNSKSNQIWILYQGLQSYLQQAWFGFLLYIHMLPFRTTLFHYSGFSCALQSCFTSSTANSSGD